MFFALAVIGIASLFARDRREGAVVFAFPVAYLLYFSMQGTMVVRNLLATAPFFAIAAARGACLVGERFQQLQQPSEAPAPRVAYVHTAWVGFLAVVLCFNAAWLISSAESIVRRNSDRFVGEAARYVRTHAQATFLLSPRVKHDVAAIKTPLANVTDVPAEADAFVLYAREGMQRWQDWPANRRDLTQVWFGPQEVNFNIYPNWWGDDRILVIDRRRAGEIGLRIAGVSEDTAPPPDVAALSHVADAGARSGSVSADALPASWALPSVDPRMLVPRAQAESIIGPLARGPVSGGWDLDGTSCTYLGREGSVVSVSIISTSAFDLKRHDAQSASVSGVGLSAYFTAPGPLDDRRLFARSLDSAIVVHIVGVPSATETSETVARKMANAALGRLDAAQAATKSQ